MQEFMKMDIFFFVTTIAVALITILLAIGLVYVILVLKRTKDFVEMVKDEGQEVIEDIKEFRVRMRTQEGILKKVPALFTFIRKITKNK